MPAPRKQKNNNTITRPSSTYVHPSLSLSPRSPSTTTSNPKPALNSVNERIEHLRRAQTPRPTAATTLEAFSRLPPTAAPPPRRRFAGPPPPRSWLEGGAGGTRTFKYGGGSSNGSLARRSRTLDYFPGVKVPGRLSLLHQAMVSMAADFEWHLEYDHIYLAALPVELKMTLLSYIAHRGPDNGISLAGLKTLFHLDNDDDDDDRDDPSATDSDELTRLDLGGSLGRALTFKDLTRFWHLKPKAGFRVAEAAPDSWELSPSLTSNLRFPALTRLSLAHPGSSVSWSDLLTFSRNLGSLSHLSLAYWPAPRLSSSSAATSAGLPVAEMSNSSEPFDLSEAAYLLKQLSRNTPSLQYLSLEGCSAWLRVLRFDASPSTPRRPHPRYDLLAPSTPPTPPSPNDAGAEWTTSWRNLTHLDLRQGWLPDSVDPVFLFRLHSSRSNYTTPFPPPRLPPTTTLPAPATATTNPPHLPPRHFPTAWSPAPAPPTTPSHHHRENYTITAAPSVAESVQAAARRREWCQRELDALLVDNWVRMLRKTAGCKVCRIEHGWDAGDLVEAGYAEQDLFEAGF